MNETRSISYLNQNWIKRCKEQQKYNMKEQNKEIFKIYTICTWYKMNHNLWWFYQF